MKSVKSILSLLPLFLLTSFLHGQEFAPIGATWHVSIFQSWGGGGISYGTIECTGDTTIQGRHCRIIEIPQTLNSTPFPSYMYEEAGKLYYLYTPDLNEPDSFKFNLLIDFSAEVGESWDMEIWSDFYAPPGVIPTSLELVVDSISFHYSNNGQDSLRVQHLSIPSDPWNTFEVIQKVGFSQGLFPDLSGWSLGCCSSINMTRCYEDSNCGLIKFIEEDCDYTGANEVKSPHDLAIYPNPTKNTVQVVFQNPALNSSLHLYNSSGQLLLAFPVTNGVTAQELDLGGYPDGLYFILWREQEAILSTGKIVKRK